MEALVAITYRCNAHCHMCNTWQYPSTPEDEIQPQDLVSLPHVAFANITGGEPFLRDDIADFVEILHAKADRIVISTNGYFTDRILELARRYPDVGFRISLEGLPAANDELRGIKDGFDHGLRTLLGLRALGVQDIGFGITLSDRNADDLLELHQLADAMDLEFATAAVHNNFYFHKFDNVIEDKEHVAGNLEELALLLLKTNRPKNWFRAWFNVGLANYVRGGQRLLPCEMGSDIFFVDPFGAIKPCNAMDASMGSLKEKPFDEIWHGTEASDVRARVCACETNCWMIGSVSPAMKKNIKVPATWVLKAKVTGRLPKVAGATDAGCDPNV
ncbi:MAG: radical SAM protein [Actinobacteria bacterium]|nr:MAG: radical SAM protein [Actinomycetota bacterium]